MLGAFEALGRVVERLRHVLLARAHLVHAVGVDLVDEGAGRDHGAIDRGHGGANRIGCAAEVDQHLRQAAGMRAVRIAEALGYWA